jgi:hypothetical protein
MLRHRLNKELNSIAKIATIKSELKMSNRPK